MGHIEPLRVKCLKCQRSIWEKDVPKRCSQGTPGFESHAYAIGEEEGEWPWIAPYGVSDADWDRETEALLEEL
mgnify:FL=1